jgi:hypothetical protein
LVYCYRVVHIERQSLRTIILENVQWIKWNKVGGDTCMNSWWTRWLPIKCRKFPLPSDHSFKNYGQKWYVHSTWITLYFISYLMSVETLLSKILHTSNLLGKTPKILIIPSS